MLTWNFIFDSDIPIHCDSNAVAMCSTPIHQQDPEGTDAAQSSGGFQFFNSGAADAGETKPDEAPGFSFAPSGDEPKPAAPGL